MKPHRRKLVHEALVVILSLATAGAWCIGIFPLSLLYRKLAGDSQNRWRQGIALAVPLLLGGLLTVVAALVLEQLLYVRP